MNPKILSALGYALIVIGALICTFLYVVFKYELFSKVKVEELSLGSGNLLFVPYQGDYTKVNTSFTPVMAELSKAFGSQIKYFGIYYDNPDLLKDSTKARAIIGGLFDETVDLKPFILSHPEYKMTSFKNLKGFGAKMPLHSSLNVLSAILRGYPIIKKYGFDRDLMSKVLCSFEVYDYANHSITIAFPYHKGNESILFQSGMPIPEAKDVNSKKHD